MTVKQKLKMMLYNMGLFEDQAKEIIDLAIPKIDKIMDDYTITWDSPEDVYPEGVYTAWFLTVKRVAKKWIAENKPEAWFRPIFE